MSKSHAAQRGQARTKRPERTQVEMQLLSLDQWLEADHRVRYVWQYVQSLDLSELYDRIKAVRGNTGRDPIDPQILFALWLFATIEGVSSARRLDALSKRDIAYMWICGGVSVNYHTLADFRVENGELLERLMVDSIAVLLEQELISLDTVAQDGMRVRANAGTDSFRRKPTLEQALADAEAHIEKLNSDQEEDPSSADKRRQAARERAAREKTERVAAAIEQLDEVNKQREKKKRKTETTRASMTDPESRKMKMPDGGFRPAYNVQLVTTGDSRVIVGVDVTNSGSDANQMGPLFEQVLENYGQAPGAYLVDGPFVTGEDVETLEKAGTELHGPVPMAKKQLDAGQDPYARKARDSDQMAGFRARMGTDTAKEKYKERPSIAEFPNADFRNRGLQQFRVRGLVKVKAQALWHAIAFNFMRFRNLGVLSQAVSS